MEPGQRVDAAQVVGRPRRSSDGRGRCPRAAPASASRGGRARAVEAANWKREKGEEVERNLWPAGIEAGLTGEGG